MRYRGAVLNRRLMQGLTAGDVVDARTSGS